ncbi:HTH-type dhaKLM operon transcriptional activator dhaS [Peptoniphilus harei]|uniref:TetR/AcrR family transcriptional regulator n=1 Tax=Peptoniphilus harei TaxID=54005 RepID=UPI000F6B383F|nr:TetR/AcrR family transcriptional regulator [Peptoniphilus harei]MDU1177470.1 TetR/AcrR family transcriptional regulator C-terminal domain-containing protein [Peptoniphilus harei]MDU2373991.1 TetR/AcrR family transcriptional regulator C-terminal domain-containing protein [Peptoniphilus harei]MDU6098679.1 TetR/AcrR family transcriptional regulator C-terminal domain-containing protein [Peptoniphilus harei]QQE47379.1 TetR/AcrR family transcriptional regulator C-terminal domain-containing protein
MAKNYTKNLIKQEFIKLLNKKSLHNITVTEIAKQCKIERKTFYYHYENLPQLVKEIFDEELEDVIEEFNETLSWEESFISATKFILENKKVVKHMYESDYKVELEKYIFSISGEIMRKYVRRVAKDTKAQEIDIKLIAFFYQCALSSSLIQWVATDMKTDPKLVTRRLGELMDGNILEALKRSENLEKLTQNFEIE